MGWKKNNVTVKGVMLIFLPVLCSPGSEDRRGGGKVSLALFCHVNLGKALSLLQEEEQAAAEDGLLGESLIVLLTLFVACRSPKATGLALEGFSFLWDFLVNNLKGKLLKTRV